MGDAGLEQVIGEFTGGSWAERTVGKDEGSRFD